MKTCISNLGLFTYLADQINDCHGNSPNGSEVGNNLMHNVATKTAALQPAHTYVPWVVADGQHTEAINDEVTADLLGFVCNNFKGGKEEW